MTQMHTTKHTEPKLKKGAQVCRLVLREGKWQMGRIMTVGSIRQGNRHTEIMCEETGVGTGTVYEANQLFHPFDAAPECERRNECLAKDDLPTIYGLVNDGSPGMYSVIALAEDGKCLSGHCCSDPGFGPHDIGATSDWHQEHYWAHYPNGFRVEWVDDPKAHKGCQVAIAKNKASGPA